MRQFDTRIGGVLKGTLLWLPLLVTLAGYLAYTLNVSAQVPRARVLLLIALGLNAASFLVHRLRREIPLALLLGGAWLAAAAFHAGLAAALATVLVTACAIGVGSLLTDGDDDAGASLLVGLAILAASVGWLLPFPVHRRWLYVLVAMLVVVLRAPAIARSSRNAGVSLRTAAADSPLAAFIVINVVGICSTPSWLPTMQADDISYHLALPFQLQELGYYRMDIAGSIWALAPWASDTIHAMAQVIAGAEARGAVNVMWMVALYAGMWRLGRMLALPPAITAAAIALHCSLPASSSLLAGMQTELPSSALLVGLVLLIGASPSITASRLASIAALAGLLLAIKLSNALLLLPLGIWMLVRSGKVLPWKSLPASVLLGAFVALPSYAYGYLITGNPALPFFNGIFKSPFFVLENWMDPAWMHPIDGLLPWRLMFETSNYLTAPAGAAGFVYLVCAAGLLIALATRKYRPLALIGLSCFLLVFSQVHFIRYTQPANALLIVAALGGFHSIGLHRSLIAAASVLCALNLSMVSTGYWQISDGALDSLLRNGPAATIERFAPQRTIAARIRAIDDGDTRVLFHRVDAHGNAELTIPALSSSWYNWSLAKDANAADADDSGARWIEILSRHDISLLIVDREKTSPGLKAALATSSRDPAFSRQNYDAWRIPEQPSQALGVEMLHAGNDFAKYRFANVGGQGSVTTGARFRCNLPNEPIVISISARIAGEGNDRNLISGWAVCTDEGIAEGEVKTEIPEGTQEMFFTAVPRSPMTFALIEARPQAQARAIPQSDPARELRKRLLGLMSSRVEP